MIMILYFDMTYLYDCMSRHCTSYCTVCCMSCENRKNAQVRISILCITPDHTFNTFSILKFAASLVVVFLLLKVVQIEMNS